MLPSIYIFLSLVVSTLSVLAKILRGAITWCFDQSNNFVSIPALVECLPLFAF